MERISDDPSRFEPGAVLVHEDGRRLEVVSARPHRNRLLVLFAGVDSRPAAENLRGALYVDATARRELDEGEFWEHELVGCRVFLVDGREVGRVARVIPRPAQDLLEIDTPAGARLVPAVKEIVVTVAPEEDRVVIDPPEGLLD